MSDHLRAIGRTRPVLVFAAHFLIYLIPLVTTAVCLSLKIAPAHERRMAEYQLLAAEIGRAQDVSPLTVPESRTPPDDGDAPTLTPLALDAPPARAARSMLATR